jgi:hypothetical protein
LIEKVFARASIQKGWVARYPVIRLAKLVLWALQEDRVASAWHPYDNHVCGTVAITTGKKEKQKIGYNCNKLLPFYMPRIVSQGIEYSTVPFYKTITCL